MYLRVTTVEVAPEGIDEAVRYFRDVTLPMVRDTPGWAGTTVHVNREKGIMRFFAHFSSREALDSTSGVANSIRSDVFAKHPGQKLLSVEIFEEALRVEPAREAKGCIVGKRST